MKKLLLLLLLLPMLAKAQYPAPAGVSNFISAQFFYKISGGDTTMYAKAANGLWFPVGRGGGSVSGAYLPLTFPSNQTIRLRSRNYLSTSDTVGGMFYFIQHNDAGITLESSTSRWSSGFGITNFTSSFGLQMHPSSKTIGWRGDTTGFKYSDKVNKILPQADSMYLQHDRKDFVLWGNLLDTLHANTVAHANNGLSLSGDTVQLGGTVTAQRQVDLNDKDIFWIGKSGSDSTAIDMSYTNFTADAYDFTNHYNSTINVSPTGASLSGTLTTGDEVSFVVAQGNGAGSSIGVTNNANSTSKGIFLAFHGVNSPGIYIDDRIDTAGMGYGQDMHVNGIAAYGNRWIPDKGYNDAHYAAIGSGGTLTNFSFTNGGGFTGTVTNPTTTPALSLTLQNATTSQSGQLTSTDWNTFNGKQGALTLTTTGTSGASTLVGNTLNIPQYSGATGANPTATAGVTAVNGSATTFMRSDAAPKVDSTAFQTVANLFPKADTRYQKTLTLTTTGTGGVATLTGSTLNIPNYGATIVNSVSNSDGTLTVSPTTGAVVGSLNLAHANTWTALQTHQFNNIITTPTNGLELVNQTASTSGVPNQYAPALHWQGRVWNTSGTPADNYTDWQQYVSTTSAATPKSTLIWRSSISTTSTPSYSQAMSLSNDGNLTTVATITAGLNLFVQNTINGGGYNLYVPFANDAGSTNFSGYLFGGASNVNLRLGIFGNNNTTLGANNNYASLIVGNNIFKMAASGTHAWAVNEAITPLGTVTTNGATTITNTASLYIGGASSAGTNNYAVYVAGGNVNVQALTASTPLQSDANKNIISSPVGQTTLVSGTKALTISGLTTSSLAFVTLVSQSGTTTTTQSYEAVCTANTLTISAVTNAGSNTVNTLDTSTINYHVVQ